MLRSRDDNLSECIYSKVDWNNAIDQTQLLTSCAYHVLRELQNLHPLEYLGPRIS